MKSKLSRILGVGLTLVLLVSLLAMPALATIANLTLVLGSTTISATTTYTATFYVGTAVPLGAGAITITFPTGVSLANITNTLDTDVTVEATAGIGGAAFGPVGAASVTTGQALAVTTANAIGAGAIVQVVVGVNADPDANGTNNLVVNPGTIGTYPLTAATSTEVTPISASFTTTGPIVLPLAGVVERYNSVGVLMEQTHVIQTAINNAAPGDTINVGSGTYDEDLVINTSVTLTGDAAILSDVSDGAGGPPNNAGGTVTISLHGAATTGVVFDGFTVMGNLGGADAMLIDGSKVTVRNCTFTKAGTAIATINQNMVHYAPDLLPTLGSTITNCTFDTTLGIATDSGVLVAAGANAIGLTVSNCTFVVDGAVGAEDSAVNTSGAGTLLLPIMISGNTISGGSGIGVTFTAGTATASGNTLSGLNSAFKVVAGTATITGNTIDACGLPISATALTGQGAITVTAATALTITNNTITNCPDNIIEIADSSENINMMFNNMEDNALGIGNGDAGGAGETLNATHNWWGDDDGPAAGFNVTAGAVNNTAGYLGEEATGTFNAGAVALVGKVTVGVDVTATMTGAGGAAAAPAMIGVGNYAENPQDVTPLPALAGGFYDVYVAEVNAGVDIASVLIKFYNANITENTKVYVWGTLAGGWVPVTATAQGVNLYEDFAYANITGVTTPTIANLTGTPFALVEAAAVAPVIPAPDILSPGVGEIDVPLKPTFAWTTIAGVDYYYVEIAKDAAFSTLVWKEPALAINVYVMGQELEYSTTYYWRVTATGQGTSTGAFTTVAAPEAAAPTAYTCPSCGLVFYDQEELAEHWAEFHAPLPPVEVEEAPAPTPVIPDYLLWTIIGIGAVLVIALIVLIVRTRRAV